MTRGAIAACAALSIGMVAIASCDAFSSSERGSVTREWFAPRSFEFLWAEQPAVQSGVLLIADSQGITAFDQRTGGLLWAADLFQKRHGGSSSNVVASDDAACVSDFFGGSGCVEVTTGRIMWTAPPDSSWSRQVALDKTRFYYGTRNHRIVARARRTGSVLWTRDVAPAAAFSAVVSGVAIKGDTLYASLGRWLNESGFIQVAELVALASSDGHELWRFTSPGQHSDFLSAPVFAGSAAIVGDVESHVLRAIDLTTRQQTWETSRDDSGYVSAERPAAISADTVFVSSTDTQVHAYSAVDGRLLWRVRGNAGSLGSTALCGRLVLAIPWTSGVLVAVDRTSRIASQPRVLLEDDELFSRIAVDGNMAYAVGMKGVYAFRCAE